VEGETFSTSGDAAGVYGRARATSGQTYGVYGVSDSPEGSGLATPGDAQIEGAIDTNDTDFVAEAGTQSTINARNVVMGHASNTVTSVVGATITGGGKDDGGTDRSHEISGDYATVLGGQNNEASGKFSIALGRNARASADGAFVVGDSTSNSVLGAVTDEARFQGSVRSGRLETETGVRYYTDDSTLGADWRTRYDTANNFWRVDENTGQNWADRMWVTSNGTVKASGSKDFVETVDTDDGEKEVHYSATEADTAHFGWVTDDDEPIHVQTTPHSADSGGLAAVERTSERLVIEDLDGDGNYEFSYTVKGTRTGYADKEVVREPSADANSTQRSSPADD
jgi:hypothetical protein